MKSTLKTIFFLIIITTLLLGCTEENKESKTDTNNSDQNLSETVSQNLLETNANSPTQNTLDTNTITPVQDSSDINSPQVNVTRGGGSSSGTTITTQLNPGYVDCNTNLNCLIQALNEGKESKATIETVFRSRSKDFTNLDYLEIVKEGQNFILYRTIIQNDYYTSGNCHFTKQQLITFLEDWNTNSFETNYYTEFNCEGDLYTTDGDFE
jgi:hypothetical protein